MENIKTEPVEHENEKTFKEELHDAFVESGMPEFMYKPNKEDKKLWLLFLLMTLFGFATIPFRIWFINNPEWYALIIGGYTSSTILGAQQSQGDNSWYFIFLTIIGALKFLPIVYLMGKQWGYEFIIFATNALPKIQEKIQMKIEESPQSLRKLGYYLAPLPYIPFIRIGTTITIPLLAISKVSMLKVFVINAISVLSINTVFFILGYFYGNQVLDIIEIINKYANWVFIGLIIFMVISITYTSQKSENNNS